MSILQSLASEWAAQIVCAVADVNEDGAAGTYTVKVPLPENTLLLNVIWSNDVLWGAGTSATLNVGDDTDAALFMNAVDVKAGPAAGRSLTPAQGEGSMLFADVAPGFYPDGGNVIAEVVTVGADSSLGRSHLTVIYAVMPPIHPVAVKV